METTKRNRTWKEVGCKCNKAMKDVCKCNSLLVAAKWCFFSNLLHRSDIGLWEAAVCYFTMPPIVFRNLVINNGNRHISYESMTLASLQKKLLAFISLMLITCLGTLMQIGECVAIWWRPNFETIMYPYCPPHITKPKVMADTVHNTNHGIVFLLLLHINPLSPLPQSFPCIDFALCL